MEEPHEALGAGASRLATGLTRRQCPGYTPAVPVVARARLARGARVPTLARRRREPDDPRAEEVIPALAEIRVGENETFESALRRFNKKIQQSGILAEARRR